ncbi:SpoIIE-like protein phosphatase domain protein [Leptospira fainei serovar Hurstbridge str. BUT 6]|uniref:SpoIIE-like protein phosphatase domain protein n=1 Tax=Leptospira fainei serovar Hurstbridge str. BUT 6 TaxID=1193011 RepID=S3V3M6_9LEPT|nr:PP2C family protein-serine/threonine phosphatase [Leptospira fainei]EPG75249.1 SpoIIE-like protein phosphatase domain protein [Leptospira fainei serovar Hurstbridge str. BUT 6]
MRAAYTIKQYFRGAWRIILVLNISLIVCFIVGFSYYNSLVRIPVLILAGAAFTLFLNYVAFALYLTERILPEEQEYGKIIKRFRRGDSRMQNYVFPLDFKDENYEVFGRCLTYNPIGGDFYNFVKDKSGNYWFGIGDTSGHGYVAGLFSMMVMNQMSHLVHTCTKPEEVIHEINLHLEERTKTFPTIHRSLYATFLLMKADSDGNFLQSGIHPSSVLFRKGDHSTEILDTDGFFLSTVMNPPLNKEKPARSFRMESGDVLFSFTDGLFEQKSRMKNSFYGENLYKFLETAPKENIRRLIDSLFEEIALYGGGRIQDDMSIIAIRKL